jgi:hypothetical protein
LRFCGQAEAVEAGFMQGGSEQCGRAIECKALTWSCTILMSLIQ